MAWGKGLVAPFVLLPVVQLADGSLVCDVGWKLVRLRGFVKSKVMYVLPGWTEGREVGGGVVVGVSNQPVEGEGGREAGNQPDCEVRAGCFFFRFVFNFSVLKTIYSDAFSAC